MREARDKGKLKKHNAEKKEILEKLEKYEIFLDAIPDIVYEIDIDGKFTFLSDNILQLGYEPKDLIGKHFNIIVHPDDINEVSREIVLPKYKGKSTGDEMSPKLFDERRTRGRATRFLELRLLNKKPKNTSKYIYAEVQSAGKWSHPIDKENKILLGSIGLIRDITKRKQIEERILSLSKFPSENPNPVLRINSKGDIIYKNSAVSGILNKLGQNKSINDILPEEYKNLVVEALENKKVINDAIVTIGSKVLSYSIVPVSENMYANLYAIDITERVKAEKQIKALDERKTTFVSHVSHEFKNPLFTIREAVKVVLDEEAGKINDRQKTLLLFVKRNSDRLLRLVIDLLDISKIEAGRLDMKREKCDIVKIVNELLLSNEKNIIKKGIALKKTLPVDLGHIWADKDRITEVIENLLTNEIKYTPAGGEISISIYGNDKEIQFEISDNGYGINSKDLDKIFDKFERVNVEKQEGTGLGLPICRDIIRLHKGKIWVESKVDQGSKFIFVLPRDFKNCNDNAK